MSTLCFASMFSVKTGVVRIFDCCGVGSKGWLGIVSSISQSSLGFVSPVTINCYSAALLSLSLALERHHPVHSAYPRDSLLLVRLTNKAICQVIQVTENSTLYVFIGIL